MRSPRSVVGFFATLALLAVPALAVQTVLLPYGGLSLPAGTTGYRYTIQPVNTPLPGFENPLFDDSTWATGATPLGGAGGQTGTCPWLWPTVVTPWTNGTDLFVRFHMELCPGATNVVVGVSIDNDVALFVNGNSVAPVPACSVVSGDGLCQTEGCAIADKVLFPVPDAFLVGGDNVFAIRARDRHVVAFLDIQVKGDISAAICEDPNDPPSCDGAAASVGSLWPPNHKWQGVSVTGVTDPDGDPVEVEITSIFQDEPVDVTGNGDGNTCPDGRLFGGNSADVRAERQGAADGRVYHLGFTATDDGGETCTGSVAVCVPHDQGQGSACIDQGALYDSTVCP